MNIKENIHDLKEKIAQHKCTLVAVSKTKPIEDILEAYDAGQIDFGENKVQEMLDKYEQLPHDIRWHLIGHLQTNKVKYIAPFVSLIHSADSLKLLKEIDKQAGKNGRIIDCLLQIHIAKEESKFGFSEEELIDLLAGKELENLKNVRIIGLMGMATFTDNTEIIRSEFNHLKKFFDYASNEYKMPNITMYELSMGMSGDFEIALEEGSTMIRVGSKIFGER
ncbi:MAG: YggS family pyridoxal phosphate-dependent enzyme [Cyclobacteriaceae bacterium]